MRYRFSRDHFRAMDTLECRGFTSATTSAAAVPLFSRYPGVPGRGAVVTSADRLIAASQSNLNDRCGLRGAALDGVFITTAGLYHRAVDLELTLPGAYDVFDPAYQEWIAFTGAAGNRRALDLSVYRFTLRGVNVTYAGGTAATTLRLVSETAAPAGRTYVPPATGGPSPNPIDFPPITFPDTPDFNLRTGAGGIALICTKGLARTTNFGSGAATVWDFMPWSSFSPSQGSGASNNSPGSGDGAYTAVPDAFSYASGSAKAWILFARGNVSNSYIYYLDVAARTWTLKHTGGEALAYGLQGSGGGMDASFGTPNHMVAVASRFANNTTVVYTTDNTTFNTVTLGGAFDNSSHKSIGVFVSPRTAGRVLLTRGDGQARISTDYGATWSATSNPNIDGNGYPSAGLHGPYDGARNAAESIFFFGVRGAGYLIRSNGGSQTVISPPGGYTLQGPRNGASSYVGDANRLLTAMVGAPILYSNALAASPSYTFLTNSTGYSYNCCAIAGDSGNTFYFWDGHGIGVGDGGVAYSNDGGATIISQRGNLGDYTVGSVVMLMGW